MTTSHYWIYPKGIPQVTSELIIDSIKMLGPNHDQMTVSRNNSPDDSWESHLKELETEEEAGGVYIFSGRDVIVPRCKINDIPSYYIDENTPLTIDMAGSQQQRQKDIVSDLQKIDPSIRREFWASNCFLTVGFHDIYQYGTETRKPEFFGRPIISLCYWDYSYLDRKEFQKSFRMLNSVMQLAADCTMLWGAVDCATTTLSD